MESQNTVHQTSQKPTAQRDLGTYLVISSDEQAPVRVFKGDKSRDEPISNSCFETPLEILSDSQQGSRGINFDLALNYQQQQKHLPSSSATYRGSSSSRFKSAKAMNADFYWSLQSGQIDSLKRMLEDEENNFLDQVTPQHCTSELVKASIS